jgi:multidrug efflux pump subunit AcrB
MAFVRFILKHPHTVAALIILFSLLGVGAALRMPIDIFPEIDIPVVSVVWTYNGMSATDIQNRILSLHERQMASLVDDISRIEATSYAGVGVEKVFLHEGAGGKPRVIMADLDAQALAARGLSPSNVSDALQRQNVILPAGDVKIGSKDYPLFMNNSPGVIENINAFPVAQVAGRTVFMRDIAHVHDGFQVQTNSVSVDGKPGALISIRKTGGASALAVIDGVRAALTDIRKLMPSGVVIAPIFDQSKRPRRPPCPWSM